MHCDIEKMKNGMRPSLSAVRRPEMPVRVAVDVNAAKFTEMFVDRLCAPVLGATASHASHTQPVAKM